MTESHLTARREWPYRPDFNQFKRQAKELLKAYRAGDANAVAEVQRHDRIWTFFSMSFYWDSWIRLLSQ